MTKHLCTIKICPKNFDNIFRSVFVKSISILISIKKQHKLNLVRHKIISVKCELLRYTIKWKISIKMKKRFVEKLSSRWLRIGSEHQSRVFKTIWKWYGRDSNLRQNSSLKAIYKEDNCHLVYPDAYGTAPCWTGVYSDCGLVVDCGVQVEESSDKTPVRLEILRCFRVLHIHETYKSRRLKKVATSEYSHP